jgi:hypothetical protein
LKGGKRKNAGRPKKENGRLEKAEKAAAKKKQRIDKIVLLKPKGWNWVWMGKGYIENPTKADTVWAHRQREKYCPEIKIEREKARFDKQQEQIRLTKWLNDIEYLPPAFWQLKYRPATRYLSNVKSSGADTLYKYKTYRCMQFFRKRDVDSTLCSYLRVNCNKQISF